MGSISKWEVPSSKKNIEWLGFKTSNTGVKQLVKKADLIKKKPETEKHFGTKVFLRKHKPVLEIRTKFINPVRFFMTIFKQKIKISLKRFPLLGYWRPKTQTAIITEKNHFDTKDLQN